MKLFNLKNTVSILGLAIAVLIGASGVSAQTRAQIQRQNQIRQQQQQIQQQQIRLQQQASEASTPASHPGSAAAGYPTGSAESLPRKS